MTTERNYSESKISFRQYDEMEEIMNQFQAREHKLCNINNPENQESFRDQ